VGADPVLLVLPAPVPVADARPGAPGGAPPVRPGRRRARRDTPVRTQTLRSEDPERSARLVWPEVPAAGRRALEHVPFAWVDPESGRPETLYHRTPPR